eukprot:1134079-Pelagomonas_calceolata.AAC.1
MELSADMPPNVQIILQSVFPPSANFEPEHGKKLCQKVFNCVSSIVGVGHGQNCFPIVSQKRQTAFDLCQ